MRVLLDTQAFLWWLSDASRLTDRAIEVLGDPTTEVCVSVASAWEIAIKARAGRLDLADPAESFVPEQIRHHGFTPLAIELGHALRAASLPRHHADPFDRLLVAQGQLEGLPIVTVDPLIGLYDVETIW
jgi:PIN domain nuclease of toxin-antitoxin system